MGTAIVLGAWLSGAAFAQAADPHAGHTMAMPTSTGQSASNAAYEQANAKMHKDMAVPLSGNADTDFLAGMIPHHQGAVDMAEVVLKYGKDPKVKKLAQEIIAAQKQEIAMMRAWLKQKQATK
ncbi:hypothetical protein BLL52_0654 [Rhodoferax antarcticus ANT.BR]|uniref:DUF305 domain-containing protein n=1 Tax=Rhodoferax antarcticus ANT.BR TaxID=1111071 RepID=A0A1Q8YJ02_9BURK|nr:DUF305 domain-containing protein [Rhodoferax antarcticus]OLP08028.1 hypothetical protein BLL52_0654 [Rhodoferax antarcticus ANT.BR]